MVEIKPVNLNPKSRLFGFHREAISSAKQISTVARRISLQSFALPATQYNEAPQNGYI